MRLFVDEFLNLNKILDLLFRKYQKKSFYFLLVLQVVSLIFELTGLLLLFGLIRLAIMPAEEKVNLISGFSNNLFGDPNLINLSLIIILVLIFYILSAVMRSFSQKKQYSFAMEVERAMGAKLFENFLGNEYYWHKINHTSKSSKNLLQDTSQIVSGYVLPVMVIYSNLILVVGVFIIGVLVNPIITMVIIGVLVVFFGLASFLFKNKIDQLSKVKETAAKKRYKFINESMSSLTDIYINNLKDQFVKNFKSITGEYTGPQSKYLTTAALPSIIIENLIVVLIIFSILYFASSISNPLTLSQITFSLILATRLLPAANRTYNAVSLVQFHKPLLMEVEKKLIAKDEAIATEELTFNKDLELNKIEFSYDRNKKIIDNFSLRIECGEKVLVKGPSGVGKSTLIEIILGLLIPGAGEILVDGKALKTKNIKSWYDQIAYVPQAVHLFDSSMRENIISNQDFDESKFNKVLEITDLLDLYSKVGKSNLGEKGSLISGGQKQRIGIARALYKNPSLLILDESTNALDEDLENAVLKKLQDNNPLLTIISISHNNKNDNLYDRIITLNNKGGYIE